MAELLVQDTSLTAIADAIRAKAESAGALSFPGGFVDAISALAAFPEGINAIASGTYTPTQTNTSIVAIEHGMKVRPNFAFILPEPAVIEEEEYYDCVIYQVIFDQNRIDSDDIGTGTVYFRSYTGDGGTMGGSGSLSDNARCGYDATNCRFYSSAGHYFKVGTAYRWFAANLTRT